MRQQFLRGLGFIAFFLFFSRQPIYTQSKPPKFEVGAQFTSLSINPHSIICPDVCLVGSDRSYTEPGVGVRFTYNLTNNIGLEAEGNLLPHGIVTTTSPPRPKWPQFSRAVWRQGRKAL